MVFEVGRFTDAERLLELRVGVEQVALDLIEGSQIGQAPGQHVLIARLGGDDSRFLGKALDVRHVLRLERGQVGEGQIGKRLALRPPVVSLSRQRPHPL